RPAGRLDVSRRLHHAGDPDGLGPIELLAQAQRFDAVGDLEVAVVVVDRDRERLGSRRVGQVLAPLRGAFAHVGLGHGGTTQAVCSTRGNRGASAVTVVPGWRMPHVPASRIGCAASAPSDPSAPSAFQSVPVDCGMTGESSTASARRPSAQVYNTVPRRARLSSSPPSACLANAHGSLSVMYPFSSSTIDQIAWMASSMRNTSIAASARVTASATVFWIARSCSVYAAGVGTTPSKYF